MLSKIGRTVRNLHPSGYGVFAHQQDQSFFRTLSFLALTMERVGTRLRVYPPSRHSLCPALSHIKTQKRGLQKWTLSKTGRTSRNLRLGGYNVFAHLCDQSFFHTLSFLTLTTERVGTRLRVYPPSKHSLCLTLSHIKTQKRGLRKRMLSKTSQTARNLRPSGYNSFAHQRNQSFF